jgi:V-type H+-transporting ATPase subunit a
VEAYAVAAYGEVNPAVFTMVTFPFLFAVMFGDVGHGLLLVLASLAIVLFEKKFDRMSKAELGQFGLVYRARYMVLLMSFASMYVGFIYNEFFSIPMNLQYSTWSETNTSIYAVKNTNATFPFGVDPAWKVSENELLFYNSLKMKMSIIIAYFHMMLGICMHAFNAVYFSRPYDLFFEFIPRVVFLTSIIGYMVLLIFWKWITVWDNVNPNCSTCLGNGASAAPYIISIMVDMFLKILDPGKLCMPGDIDTPCADNSTCVYEYMLGCPTQGYVELILIILAVASIPVMLLVKPLLMRRDAKKAGNEEFEFGEVFVHQVIETIEFVLGAISNTASYLRLWALSLAHSELSIVFWEKILVTGMHEAANSASIGWILMFGTWAIWGFFTLGVILGMEGLSAFLHTLRLHWVEFQNKFYNVVGTGLKFKPFSFRKIEELYIDEITGGV